MVSFLTGGSWPFFLPLWAIFSWRPGVFLLWLVTGQRICHFVVTMCTGDPAGAEPATGAGLATIFTGWAVAGAFLLQPMVSFLTGGPWPFFLPLWAIFPWWPGLFLLWPMTGQWLLYFAVTMFTGDPAGFGAATGAGLAIIFTGGPTGAGAGAGAATIFTVGADGAVVFLLLQPTMSFLTGRPWVSFPPLWAIFPWWTGVFLLLLVTRRPGAFLIPSLCPTTSGLRGVLIHFIVTTGLRGGCSCAWWQAKFSVLMFLQGTCYKTWRKMFLFTFSTTHALLYPNKPVLNLTWVLVFLKWVSGSVSDSFKHDLPDSKQLDDIQISWWKTYRERLYCL